MKSLIIFFIIFASAEITHAQQKSELVKTNHLSLTAYYSKGFDERAKLIASRTEKALLFHKNLLGFEPKVTLLVLSKNDWSRFTDFPVYGMPHYNDKETLIVAAEDNEFWKSFLPPLEQLPADFRKAVTETYKNSNNEISMQAFFDLLALHELGHAFHQQGGLTMQRKWMGELFCNILLHTYIAENEQQQLPALTLFPKMVIAGGIKGFTYIRLKDIEERYDEIGREHARNYGWYQCRWHKAAGDIYETNGKLICKILWNALLNQKIKLNDEELLLFFDKSGAITVADMMRYWERDMIK